MARRGRINLHDLLHGTADWNAAAARPAETETARASTSVISGNAESKESPRTINVSAKPSKIRASVDAKRLETFLRTQVLQPVIDAAVRQDRVAHDDNNDDGADDVDISPAPLPPSSIESDYGCPPHSFRSRSPLLSLYCAQCITLPINDEARSLLSSLADYQHRAIETDPVKAKLRGRRFVTGLKECTKLVRRNGAKCLIVASDIEAGTEFSLEALLDMAYRCAVPIIFALSRRSLGRACHLRAKASAVCVASTSGADACYQSLIARVSAAREQWQMLGFDTLVNADIEAERADVSRTFAARQRQLACLRAEQRKEARRLEAERREKLLAQQLKKQTEQRAKAEAHRTKQRAEAQARKAAAIDADELKAQDDSSYDDMKAPSRPPTSAAAAVAKKPSASKGETSQRVEKARRKGKGDTGAAAVLPSKTKVKAKAGEWFQQ